MGVISGSLGLTKVSNDVLPAPLGPISNIEGSCVRPLALKTKLWRKTGVRRTSRIAIPICKGDRSKKKCSTSESAMAVIAVVLAIVVLES